MPSGLGLLLILLRHQRQLTIKPDNKNFLIRKLYEDISSHHFIYCLLLVLFANLIIETLDFITTLDCHYMCWLAF